MTTYLYLPDPGLWPVTPVTPRDTINDSSTSAFEAQDTRAAENSPLPVMYGTPRVGPKISNVLYVGSSIVILAVWGHGEVDSIVELDMDDKPVPTGVTYTHYLGGSGNTVSSTLVSAFAAQSPPVVYSDTLPGICYSVITVPQSASSGFPRFTALIKGLKVYDPRSNLLTYSEQFSNIMWLKTNVTLASTTEPSPKGDLSTTLLTAGANGGSLIQYALGTIGAEYTVTLWLKRKSGGGLIYLQGVDATSSSIAVASEWVQASYTTTATTSDISCGLVLETLGDEVYVWGAQLEQSNTHKGYVRTTDSVSLAGTRWSDEPALCIANFITNPVYGMGRVVDYSSVGKVAFDNAYLVGTAPNQERSRILDISLETVQNTQSWLDTLRVYASCWIIPSGTGYKLISDKVSDPIASFSHDSGNILNISNLKKRGIQNVPTVMTVTYRDTSTKPYRDGTAVVEIPGQRRESTISLPGITRYSQAYREAFERLKKLTLNDLSCNLLVTDEALKIDVGDVVTVSHPLGLADKPFRVMGITGEYGRYDLTLVEYDPAVYNNSINITPTYTDTNIPSPSEPPAITNVNMSEEVFQLANGTWSSRWRVTWESLPYVFLQNYRVELWDTLKLIHTGNTINKEWPTPAIQEGVTYTAKVYAVSSISSVGPVGIAVSIAEGKLLLPSDVPSISVFEAGGTVYASWTAAVDIDIWRYEVRYGTTGTLWAACNTLDRVDALTLTTDLIPVGTWVIKVKAIDSVGQESLNEATTTVTVTSDASAFLVDTKQQTNPTLTNMAEFTLARTDTNRYFVSEDGVAFGTKFPNPLATYTDPLATYHTSMTSGWLGEVEDYGLLLGGQWSATADVTDLGGSHQSYLGHSVDASTWSYPAGLSQKLNARFARIKHEALTTATMLVTIPNQSIRVDAVPKTETGTVTTSASGPVTVTLANTYTSIKSLQVTGIGSVPMRGTVDNIRIGGGLYVEGDYVEAGYIAVEPNKFDVYLFNAADAKMVGDAFWVLEAV